MKTKDQLSMLDPAPKSRPTRRCPPDFQITPDLRTWAAEKAPDVNLEEETEAMKDYEFKVAHHDWPAAWRTWMRREQKAVARFKPKYHHVSSATVKRFRTAEEVEAEERARGDWGGMLPLVGRS